MKTAESLVTRVPCASGTVDVHPENMIPHSITQTDLMLLLVNIVRFVILRPPPCRRSPCRLGVQFAVERDRFRNWWFSRRSKSYLVCMTSYYSSAIPHYFGYRQVNELGYWNVGTSCILRSCFELPITTDMSSPSISLQSATF